MVLYCPVASALQEQPTAMYGKRRGQNHASRALSQRGETFLGLRQFGMTSPSAFPLAAWGAIHQQSAGRVFAYDASHPCRRMWAGNVGEELGSALPASDCRAARPEGEAMILKRKKICDFCHLHILSREK